MFSISQIRAQARQTISSTPGIFLLPIIPVAMTFIGLCFNILETIPCPTMIQLLHLLRYLAPLLFLCFMVS